MTTETKTEEVEIKGWNEFREGDIVVRHPDNLGRGALIIQREVSGLPTTNGSIVVQSEADSRDEPRWSAFLLDGMWRSTENGQQHISPEEWRNGWTLVYEAPANSLPTVHEIDSALRGGSESYVLVVDSLDAARRVWSLLKERS